MEFLTDVQRLLHIKKMGEYILSNRNEFFSLIVHQYTSGGLFHTKTNVLFNPNECYLHGNYLCLCFFSQSERCFVSLIIHLSNLEIPNENSK